VTSGQDGKAATYDREEGGEAKAGSDGEAHADLTVREREDLGRVGEGDRALSGRVERGEEEDEEGNKAEPGVALRGDQEAQSGGEQRPGHVGEGEEQQIAPAKRVDCEDGREGEEEVDGAETERSLERIARRVVGLHEDGRRVEGDDVDTA
jgi:hypothetical protein